MQSDILRGVAHRAPGAPDEPWEAVIAAAERAPAARVPGSLRHSEESWGRLSPCAPITPAAVLVAIVERAGARSVLLTRRAEQLARHAGQISFPGGRADPGDGNPQQTALREAEEEIGLPAAQVEIAGRLDDYLVGTGYRITPVVGFVRAPPAFAADTREVAEIFEVPLPFVLDAANYRRDKLTVGGVERRFYVLAYGAYHIWGATAAILVNLRDVVHASC